MFLSATRVTTLITFAGALGACSTVGTVSIEKGRTPYNEVIQSTSEQQTLLNIVRVHDGETPLFVDVTEVDALTSAQAGIMGGPTAIGAPGTSGAITLTGQYQEQPTVRYQPLLGAALVAQVSTPVTAESIVNLYNSGWPLGSIFDLTVTRFTPAFDDYHSALDALITLDRYGALILEAKPPEKPQANSKDALGSLLASAPKVDANLIIHFQPAGYRDRFGPCDEGKRAARVDPKDNFHAQVEATATKLWQRVQTLLGQHTNPLVLTLKSGSASRGSKRDDKPPLLQTRSALGMLKEAAEGDNLVEFATQEQVDAIIAKTAGTGEAKDQQAGINGEAQRSAAERPEAAEINGKCRAFFYKLGDNDTDYNNRRFALLGNADAEARRRETAFGDDRRLILIRMTVERPADAFAAIFHKGRWYSLRDDDLISKRNLALVAQIDTIQAVQPQTQPLTPTINVGGR